MPLVVLLLALFGLAVDLFQIGPPNGSISSIKTLFEESPRIPARMVFAVWLFEAFSLTALYLLLAGRSAAWWLDGIVAGWMAWIFRGPLLVLAVVFAAGQRRDPWWELVFGWWVLYTVVGIVLTVLARRQGLVGPSSEQQDKPPRALTSSATDLESRNHDPKDLPTDDWSAA